MEHTDFPLLLSVEVESFSFRLVECKDRIKWSGKTWCKEKDIKIWYWASKNEEALTQVNLKRFFTENVWIDCRMTRHGFNVIPHYLSSACRTFWGTIHRSICRTFISIWEYLWDILQEIRCWGMPKTIL